MYCVGVVGEEPARSAMAGLFGRHSSLSFERLATSLIVVSEHELVFELFTNVVADHRVAAHHALDGGSSGLMVIPFAAAVGAVVSCVAVEAASPAVAPI